MKALRTYLGTMVVATCMLCLAPDGAHAQKGITRSGDTITTPSGLRYVVTRKGKGTKAKKGDFMEVHYTGTLLDGTVFDSSREREPFTFKLGEGQVIRGWDEGIALLQGGDRATFIIPANLAYGERAVGPIPANSTLNFDVEVVGIHSKSVGGELSKAIETKGLDAAWKTYTTLKKNRFKGVYLSESELNMLGYNYLQKEKVEEAVEIFKINADAFPNSFNVYDSLGEGCLKKGDRELAIANYRKSLELNPDNDNATQMLKMISEGTATNGSGQ